MKYSKEQEESARKYLLETIKLEPGDYVYCFLKSVSSSGMSRQIAILVGRGKDIYNISKSVGWLLDERINKSQDALSVSGAGMDMGFACVYNLASVLWPKGDGKYITGRNGDTMPETDGGYLLRHSWL